MCRRVGVPKEDNYVNYSCTYSFLYHPEEIFSNCPRTKAYFIALLILIIVQKVTIIFILFLSLLILLVDEVMEEMNSET